MSQVAGPRYWLLDVAGQWAGARLDTLVADAGGALVLAPVDPTDPTAGLARSGTFVAAPADAPEPVVWGTVSAMLDPAGGGRVRLFTCATGLAAEPPPLPDDPPVGGPDETPLGQWRGVPPGVLAAFPLHPPSTRLWVAGRLEGDGTTTPAIRQVRVDEADGTWLALLPAAYRRDEGAARLLSGLLALLKLPFDELDRRLADVPLLLDPRTAPDAGAGSSALEELAAWVGVELDEAWDEARRRKVVAGAVVAAADRGTPAGIAAAVTAATGIPVTVEEPGEWASVWSLGSGALGLSTGLPAADPEPAVVGAATLSAAELGEVGDYGAPALGPLAGRVTVLVREAELGPGGAAPLAAVLEAERPAYARAHLCVVRPLLRLGVQARLGVDAILAGPPPALRLGQSRLGASTTATDASTTAGNEPRVTS